MKWHIILAHLIKGTCFTEKKANFLFKKMTTLKAKLPTHIPGKKSPLDL